MLLDVMGKEVLARVFQERDWHKVDDTIIMEERKLSRNWSWIDAQWTLLRGDQRHEITVSHRLYSAVELEMLLKQGGFRKVDIFGGLDGSPYNQTARRLVAVAKV